MSYPSRFFSHSVAITTLLAALWIVPAAAANTPVASPTAAVITPLLPAPELGQFGPGGRITLMLPRDWPLSTSRLRVGLYEAERPVLLSDMVYEFAVTGDRLATQLRLEANPGRYELRIITSDKVKQPISGAVTLVVGGVDHTPGWWLLNGELITTAPAILTTNNSATGLPSPNAFVTGLKRSGKKAKSNAEASFDRTLWNTVDLPAIGELSRPGFDFTALKLDLQRQIALQAGGGATKLLGFSLPVGAGTTDATTPGASLSTVAVVAKVKELITSLDPLAALLLRVAHTTDWSVELKQFEDAAPLCDAAVLDDDLWATKTGRRIAEEQSKYDLPLFVQFHGTSRSYPLYITRSLDLLMAGATGFVLPPHGGHRYRSETTDNAKVKQIFARNSPLFVGGVTLEDIGLLPGMDNSDPSAVCSLYDRLRGARRIPLLARLPKDKAGKTTEPFVMDLGDRISTATIERLRVAAAAGARLYVEGVPTRDENGKEAGWRLATLLGGDITVLKGPRRTYLTVEDGWMFGTGRGMQVPLEQRFAITLGKGTVGGQAQQQKGRYSLSAPRVAARLADGSPALIVNPVGKGEVVWMPHRLIDTTVHRPVKGGGPYVTPANVDHVNARATYDAAVAAYLQPALVQVRGTDAKLAGTEAVQVALRCSAKGTFLLALFNTSDQPAAIAASVEGILRSALDLESEEELPVTVKGFSSEVSTTIAPYGWRLIALAESRLALDADRNAPRLKAKLLK